MLRLVCFVCTDSEGSNPDYFLIFLNILIPIFGLRKNVPGSPLFRAGKSPFSCREVPFAVPGSPLPFTTFRHRFVEEIPGRTCREVPCSTLCSWGQLKKGKFTYAKHLTRERKVSQNPTLSGTLISRRVLRQFSASGRPFEIAFSPVRQTVVFATLAAWMQPTSCLGSGPKDC